MTESESLITYQKRLLRLKTARDRFEEYCEVFSQIAKAKYKKKIVVAGNHDNLLQTDNWFAKMTTDFDYLCDSGTEFTYWPPLHPGIEGVAERKKYKIWGSPWTKSFRGMNPMCKAFTVDTEEELAEKWKMIPDDVDILITHSPAYGMRDIVPGKGPVGSVSLQMELTSRLNPKLMVVGHIHEGYGQESQGVIVDRYVNASHVNECYKPVNKPIRIIL